MKTISSQPLFITESAFTKSRSRRVLGIKVSDHIAVWP